MPTIVQWHCARSACVRICGSSKPGSISIRDPGSNRPLLVAFQSEIGSRF